MKKSFAAVLFAVAGAALFTACSKTNLEANNGAPPAEAPVVPVAQIKTDNLARTLTLTAEFKPYQEVDVMAKVAGYIKQINVDIGDRVTQGQLLATLEIPEMDDDLRRADASVERSN
jgi:multidrug efflux pump subunit AcrA (membrane-fusion protein)